MMIPFTRLFILLCMDWIRGSFNSMLGSLVSSGLPELESHDSPVGLGGSCGFKGRRRKKQFANLDLVVLSGLFWVSPDIETLQCRAGS